MWILRGSRNKLLHLEENYFGRVQFGGLQHLVASRLGQKATRSSLDKKRLIKTLVRKLKET